jgi:hypothetical protein
MKGIIFTELLEMMEEEHGPSTINSILEKVKPESKGVYTSVGNYEHKELVDILHALAFETNSTINKLMRDYGYYLFNKFTSYYPGFFENKDHSLDFLESVDTYIHQEVKKLYPNAELPTFECNRLNHNSLEMIYSSIRRMEDFAHGLILACLDHFKQTGRITMHELNNEQVIFTVEIYE